MVVLTSGTAQRTTGPVTTPALAKIVTSKGALMATVQYRTARKPTLGFTLIELMITVAVIAILSAVALPSYREYVIRGNIPEATSRLATKQVQMEQFFQDNRTYVAGTGCTTDTTSSRFFDFTCVDSGDAVTANAYILTAVGKGSMVGFRYTINQTGAKTTRAVPAGWTAPTDCWATKKGGTC
jgi:type IV pilus assembly protein PilE